MTAPVVCSGHPECRLMAACDDPEAITKLVVCRRVGMPESSTRHALAAFGAAAGGLATSIARDVRRARRVRVLVGRR